MVPHFTHNTPSVHVTVTSVGENLHQNWRYLVRGGRGRERGREQGRGRERGRGRGRTGFEKVL